MGDPSKKRVSVKHTHPNPLFERWLTEWRDKAKQQDSKMQYCFSLAIKTLRQYPLPLESGKDCKILKGFGEKLCKMLDNKLKDYKAQNGNVNPIQPEDIIKAKTQSPQKKTRREYVPQYGSGAFAILVTLYEKSAEAGFPGHLTKEQIIEHGQHISNASFTKPGPDTRYTAWSSMKNLLEKKLVMKLGNPAQFSLTNEGSALADKLYVQQKIQEFQEQEENESLTEVLSLQMKNPTCPESKIKALNCDTQKSIAINCNDENIEENISKPSCSGISSKKPKKTPLWGPSSSATSTSSHSSSAAHETVIIGPNSFEIILLVDNQELNGSRDAENYPIIRELKNLNVRHETRNLKVGDYSWICRDSSANELVLPYIIERKRMDDLGKSIQDSRFHEQKFRLKQCGLQNVIYLIENYAKNEHVGLPINTLYQAALNTLIHDGFTVKFTNNGKDSCGYLACLTNFLETLFKEKTLVSCPKEDLPQLILDDDLTHLMLFKDFNKSSTKSKHFKVREMFVRQLLQIKGMSVDKALAVINKYPTPKLLKLTYSEIGEIQGEKLFSNIQYGALRKNVGPVLSKTVYQFFCNNSY